MGVARPVDLDPHQAISVSLLLVLFVTLGAPSVASLLDQPYLAARSAHVAGRLAFFVVVPSLAAFVLHWDGGPLTC
jgi:hypothetical protein